jgi:hypothetical protein
MVVKLSLSFSENISMMNSFKKSPGQLYSHVKPLKVWVVKLNSSIFLNLAQPLKWKNIHESIAAFQSRLARPENEGLLERQLSLIKSTYYQNNSVGKDLA